MDNGIEIPVNDMSGQGNSQKLANDLNLALDMGYERLIVGYIRAMIQAVIHGSLL